MCDKGYSNEIKRILDEAAPLVECATARHKTNVNNDDTIRRQIDYPVFMHLLSPSAIQRYALFSIGDRPLPDQAYDQGFEFSEDVMDVLTGQDIRRIRQVLSDDPNILKTMAVMQAAVLQYVQDLDQAAKNYQACDLTHYTKDLIEEAEKENLITEMLPHLIKGSNLGVDSEDIGQECLKGLSSMFKSDAFRLESFCPFGGRTKQIFMKTSQGSDNGFFQDIYMAIKKQVDQLSSADLQRLAHHQASQSCPLAEPQNSQ